MTFLDFISRYWIIFLLIISIFLIFLVLVNKIDNSSKIKFEEINKNKIEKNPVPSFKNYPNDEKINKTKIEKNITNNTNKNLLILENKSMYHCFKLKDNKIVYEVYLSNNNFYEYFNYDTPFFRTYINGVLYEQVLNNLNCNLVIREYDNIYENFKLNLEYNSNKYQCEKIDLDESVFKIDKSLTICKDYIDYPNQVIIYEN